MDSMMDKTRARRVRMLRAGTALALGAALAGCGGGGEDTGSGGTTPSPSPAPTPTPPVETLALGACEASGKGTDYQVGPGKTYTALDQVPWESLKAGDTVRIHPAPTPYRGKFAIVAQGTADAPVRICGVRGADGSRPVIDADGATTRAALSGLYGSSTYARDIHQDRSLIVIKSDPPQVAPADA